MTKLHLAAAFVCALATAASAQARPPCQVVGDSLAVGLGWGLPCAVSARVGISSSAVVGRVAGGYAWTFVSLGSNDPGSRALEANMAAARTRAGGRVAWIVPHVAPAGARVAAFARAHGDPVITFAGRGVHPAGYGPLHLQARRIMGAR